MLSQDTPKNTLINMRVHSSTRDFIDQAAKSIGKDRSEFMLDAAYEKAQEILLDRTEFFLDDVQWEAFNCILDNPPKPNEKLLTLLATKAPWE
ncbi:MAG: DUF1778 domain-containing protein [Pseudomonadales bacterium]